MTSRLTTRAFRKAIRNAAKQEKSIASVQMAKAPMGRKGAIDNACEALVSDWCHVDENNLLFEWSDARDRCWICADKFSNSEKKRGPIVEFGAKHILACRLCETRIKDRVLGMVVGDEVSVFVVMHRDARGFIRETLGPWFEGMYLNERHGALRFAEFIAEKKKIVQSIGASNVSLEVRMALELLEMQVAVSVGKT